MTLKLLQIYFFGLYPFRIYILLYICYAWFLSYNLLRSFGHQGALYYVFLASDPLKTSREYAVFTLRTCEPMVCTRETSRQTQRVSAFLFWLRQMIALLHTSRGKLAARTYFHDVSMNEKRKVYQEW